MKQDSVSTAGASDIRELARVFVRVGITKADFLAALKKRYGRITAPERKWLDEVWATTVAAPENRGIGHTP